jgi:hypothetical protein
MYLFGVRAASGIPRDAALGKPRKAVARSSGGCRITAIQKQPIFVFFEGKERVTYLSTN